MKNEPTSPQMPTRDSVTSSVLLGVVSPVPAQVALCPECQGRLYWQTDSTDLRDGLQVDCENDFTGEDDLQNEPHRYWQCDWEPVLRTVRLWIERTYLGPPDKEI